MTHPAGSAGWVGCACCRFDGAATEAAAAAAAVEAAVEAAAELLAAVAPVAAGVAAGAPPADTNAIMPPRRMLVLVLLVLLPSEPAPRPLRLDVPSLVFEFWEYALKILTCASSSSTFRRALRSHSRCAFFASSVSLLLGTKPDEVTCTAEARGACGCCSRFCAKAATMADCFFASSGLACFRDATILDLLRLVDLPSHASRLGS